MRSAGQGRIVGSVVLACAVLTALVALDHRSNTGVVYRGVEVAGEPVGGKTPAEARDLLEKGALGRLDEIEITAPGGDFALKAEEMSVDLEVAASVGEAYAVGRRGRVGERLGERLRASVRTVAVPPPRSRTSGSSPAVRAVALLVAIVVAAVLAFSWRSARTVRACRRGCSAGNYCT